MALKTFLEEHDIYKSTVKKIPLLHGDDLRDFYLKLSERFYKALASDTPDELLDQQFSQTLGLRPSLNFLKQHLPTEDVIRTLLSVEPKLRSSNLIANLAAPFEVAPTDTYEQLYTQVYYSSLALLRGELNVEESDRLLDMLHEALSQTNQWDEGFQLTLKDPKKRMYESRCYALQGDIHFYRKERAEAIGSYDLASASQSKTITNLNPKETQRRDYQRAVALRTIGEHEDAQTTMRGVINSLTFMDQYEADPDQEFDIDEVSYYVTYNLQAVMINLDTISPSYHEIAEILDKVSTLIKEFPLADRITELYNFCLGWFHAAPVLEGDNISKALDIFQAIPVFPKNQLWTYIQPRINSGFQQPINIYPQRSTLGA